MRMVYGCTGGFAVILKNQDTAEALVVFQIEHAVAVSPKNIFESAFGNRRERGSMIRRFNYDLVRADAIHFVEKTFALAVQFAFNFQCRKFVGYNTNRPAGGVRAAAISSIDEQLRRRF